jgi:hypothetical protein
MIASQLNILTLAKSYLTSATSSQYTEVVSPLFISSAGAHMRHILDHYIAIMKGLEVGLVDYDKRSRGGTVESDINAALKQLTKIESFLSSLNDEIMAQHIKLSTEISVEKKQVKIVSTTLARELIFVASHAIHHFAMIDQISKAQKSSSPEQFGIAPATATFLRNNTNSKDKCAH